MTHLFPDDATDAEISAALDTAQAPLTQMPPRESGDREPRIGAGPPLGEDFKVLGVNIHVPAERAPRPDENMAEIGGVGIPPEAVLMGPLQAGRAMLKSGVSLAGRAAAGASSLAGSAAPMVKYEIARRALQHYGVPEPAAVVIAMGISGYKRGAKAPVAAAETAAVEGAAVPSPSRPVPAAPAPRPTPAAAAPRPAAQVAPQASAAPTATFLAHGPDGPLYNIVGGAGNRSTVTAAGLQKLGIEVPATPAATGARLNGEQLRAEALATRAPLEAVPKPAAFNPNTALKQAKDAFVKVGEVPRPAEASNAMEFIRRGLTPEEAVQRIVSLRPKVALSPAEQLAQLPGMMSDAEARAALDLRNARGKIKTPSAQTARERAGR